MISLFDVVDEINCAVEKKILQMDSIVHDKEIEMIVGDHRAGQFYIDHESIIVPVESSRDFEYWSGFEYHDFQIEAADYVIYAIMEDDPEDCYVTHAIEQWVNAMSQRAEANKTPIKLIVSND